MDEALLAGEALDRPGLVKALLDRGADPNVSRPLISAINPRRGDDAASLELVRLLVEVGRADVAREYDRFGNKDDTFTALEFAEMNGRPSSVGTSAKSIARAASGAAGAKSRASTVSATGRPCRESVVRTNRRQTEFHGPNRSGRSRHGAPVLAIQRTALRNNRSRAAGPGRGGSNARTRSQSASEMS